MKLDRFECSIVGFLVGGFFVIGMVLWGDKPGQIRQEAIDHGVAEYVLIDPKTGETEFRWKGAGDENN